MDRQSSGIAGGETTRESVLKMQQTVGAEQQFTQKTWSNWKRSGTRTLLRERPASSKHACDVLTGSIDGSYFGTSRCGTSSARSSIGMERIPISITKRARNRNCVKTKRNSVASPMPYLKPSSCCPLMEPRFMRIAMLSKKRASRQKNSRPMAFFYLHFVLKILEHLESLFAFRLYLFIFLYIAVGNRFNPHNLTASAAN